MILHERLGYFNMTTSGAGSMASTKISGGRDDQSKIDFELTNMSQWLTLSIEEWLGKEFVGEFVCE